MVTSNRCEWHFQGDRPAVLHLRVEELGNYAHLYISTVCLLNLWGALLVSVIAQVHSTAFSGQCSLVPCTSLY